MRRIGLSLTCVAVLLSFAMWARVYSGNGSRGDAGAKNERDSAAASGTKGSTQSTEQAKADERGSIARWMPVTNGVVRSSGFPTTYALISDDAAVLFGATEGASLKALEALGVKRIERCFVTHHHRDSVALVPELLNRRVPVLAAKSSADWLSEAGVSKYWQTSLPMVPPDREPGLRDRSFGVFSYLVVPTGDDRIECSLEHGTEFDWRGHRITAIATPGHSRDHFAFTVGPAVARAGAAGANVQTRDRTRGGDTDSRLIVFSGDAVLSRGKMWTPYTTDWDHWTDAGLKAAAESLRKLAVLKPTLLCPEHGEPIRAEIPETLEVTAAACDEAGFLKSFERFSKMRVGTPPDCEFLAKDQVATAGEKPWTELSKHLFLTGNTYVLSSSTGGLLVVDPYGEKLAEQISTLRRERGFDAIERVLVSHAHNDHYLGLYRLPDRKRFEVWTLDVVADPLKSPFEWCAFALDLRSLQTDRWLKSGETATWREYEFQVDHFPGQTWFTMGIKTRIDGRTCYFTADNFFHIDQFSGSGGWSGRNRGWPDAYAASARRILDAAPDWILAEHGGAFVFNAEDFRRRERWGQAAAAAIDALSPTGKARVDWNPSHLRITPVRVSARPGDKVSFTLSIDPTSRSTPNEVSRAPVPTLPAETEPRAALAVKDQSSQWSDNRQTDHTQNARLDQSNERSRPDGTSQARESAQTKTGQTDARGGVIVSVFGRDLAEDIVVTVDEITREARIPLTLKLRPTIRSGRHVFPVSIRSKSDAPHTDPTSAITGSDVFAIVDVE